MGGFESPVVESEQQIENTSDGFVSFDQLNLTYNKSVALRAIGSMRKPKLGFGRLRPVLPFAKSRNASVESLGVKVDQDMIANLPVLSSQHVRASSESASRILSPAEQRRPSAVSDDLIKQHCPVPMSPTAPTAKANKKLSKDGSSRRVPSMGPMQTESKPLPLAVDIDNKKLSRIHIADLLAVKPLPDPTRTTGPEVFAHRTPRISSMTPWIDPNAAINTAVHNRQVSESSVESDLHSASTDRSSSSREDSWPTSQATSPPDTPTTSVYPSLRISAYNNVELTLASTIEELKELQGDWCPDDNDMTPEAQPWTSEGSFQQSYDQRDWAYSASGYFQPSTTPMHLQDTTPQLLPASTFVPTLPGSNVKINQSIEHGLTEHRLAAMTAQLALLEAQNADLSRSAMEAEENLQAVLARLSDDESFNAAKSNDRAAQLEEELAEEKKASHDLQARLNESNVQTLELLERQYELRNDSSQPLSYDMPFNTPTEEVEDLKRNLNKLVKKNLCLKQQLDTVISSSPTELLQAKIADLEALLIDRDSTIAQLRESQHTNTKRTMIAETEAKQKTVELESLRSRVKALKDRLDAPSGTSSSAASFTTVVPSVPEAEEDNEATTLRSQLSTSQKDLHKISKERDQLASLLHSEIRRTAIQEHNRVHPNANFLKLRPDYESSIEQARQRARKHVMQAMAAISAGEDLTLNTTSTATVTSTEASAGSSQDAVLAQQMQLQENATARDLQAQAKEIEYYLQDIVLYKLDVKGYKKDLKRLRAERDKGKDHERERERSHKSSSTASSA